MIKMQNGRKGQNGQQKRKRNMSLHYSVIVLLVLIIFSVLSVTVFFNIDTAVVSGSSIYTADEIIRVSGIQGGDNMIRKNLGRAEKAITAEGGYMIISETGKILSLSEEPAEDTPVFYGVNPAEELKPGDTFKSEDETKTEVIYELIALLENRFVSKITSFDVNDRLNINCLYDNRIDI